MDYEFRPGILLGHVLYLYPYQIDYTYLHPTGVVEVIAEEAEDLVLIDKHSRSIREMFL